jgi:RNA-binding protein 8A
MQTDKDTYQSLDQQEGAGGSMVKSIEGYIICVTGINEEAQEEDIQDAFSVYGDIKNLHLNLNRRTGYVKGYAFLEFESLKEARKAIDGMNGKTLLGLPIQVDWAFRKPQP